MVKRSREKNTIDQNFCIPAVSWRGPMIFLSHKLNSNDADHSD